MVNPYEKWEDEGLHAEDRLLPSLLKETLCSEEWWKATYDGKDLYFNFEEEGMAVSSSSLNEAPINTAYHLNWVGDYAVEILFDKDTHMSFMSEGYKERVIVVTSMDAGRIVAKGKQNGQEIILNPADEDEYEAMEAHKMNYILSVENEIYTIGQNAGELRVKITGGDWSVVEPDQDWLTYDRRDGDYAVFSYTSAPHRFRVQEVSVKQVDPDNKTLIRTFVVSGTSVLDFTQTYAKADLSKNEALKEINELTYEALICPTAFPNTINTVMGVEGKFLIRLGDSGYPADQLQVAYTGGKCAPGELAAIPKNQWTHLAVTMNPADGSIRVYINGENVFTDSNNVTVDITDFKIGRSGNYTTRYFSGYMAEIRVWTRALTAEEINAENHFFSIDPKAEDLLAYWRCDDGSGKSLLDATGNGYDCIGDWADDSRWKPMPSSFSLPE